MPYFVNGQPVAEDLIRREAEPIGRDLRWRSVPDEAERAGRIRAAAEYAAVNRVLVQQAASADPRPVDANAVAGEMQRLKAEWGCRSSFDDSQLRESVERGLRIQRTTREMVAGAAMPTAEQVEAFYDANRENFRNSELFQAGQIVKHVNHEQSETGLGIAASTGSEVTLIPATLACARTNALALWSQVRSGERVAAAAAPTDAIRRLLRYGAGGARRSRVSNGLLDFGMRVQEGVFVANLEEAHGARVAERLRRLRHPDLGRLHISRCVRLVAGGPGVGGGRDGGGSGISCYLT
jgi:hypothetical protein